MLARSPLCLSVKSDPIVLFIETAVCRLCCGNSLESNLCKVFTSDKNLFDVPILHPNVPAHEPHFKSARHVSDWTVYMIFCYQSGSKCTQYLIAENKTGVKLCTSPLMWKIKSEDIDKCVIESVTSHLRRQQYAGAATTRRRRTADTNP